jgi:alkylated DNA repair dioxygenase AlkB
MYTYYDRFIMNPDEWFDRLWSELDWERRIDAPRREYWTNPFNRPYTYGRGAGERTYESRPEHELVERARNLISFSKGAYLEGCFLNGYENARDWLGWHADDDKGIDHSKPIGIITLGQERRIEFREVLVPPEKGVTKGEYGPIMGQMLKNGSLCLMHAGAQFTHQHRIPKVDHEVKPRVSLTFRGLISLPE